MDFRGESVASLAADVRAGRRSARDLVATAIDRIEEGNADVNAFVAVDYEAALEEARGIDDRVAAGEDPGPLAGIPIGVKDLEDAVGFVTTHGSAAHVGDAPATVDSLLVERLRDAGCVVVGKTNTPEFGWKAETVNPVFGATRNPLDLARSAGGSSGGSAAAIVAGMVPLATGSDGGGSIRIPSAVCGLSGMKPSLGRVPNGGAQAGGWPDLSTRGPMARRIRDVAVALDAVIGPDPTDIRALPMPEASWSLSLDDPHPPRRVGWSPTLGFAKVDAEVLAVCEQAVRTLESLGTEIVEVDPVFSSDPVREWLTLAMTYNLRSLERFGDTPVWDQLDPGLVAAMEWARARVTAVDLVRAGDRCLELNLELVRVLHRGSLLLTPTCAGQTPFVDEPGMVNGEPELNWVQFTYPLNLTRSPAGTVCAGHTADGMPVGLQVIGPQHGDVAVLRLLALLEDALSEPQASGAGRPGDEDARRR
ncbi:amidase [soil metagenome]